MLKTISYYIFNPGGNDTALVLGNNFTSEAMMKINKCLLEKHTNVEQVGFLSEDEYKLSMAGNEFCGNATRSAVFFYLDQKPGEIEILVSNNLKLKAGINNRKVWSQMPIATKNQINLINEDITEVNLCGISFLIVSEELSNKYLCNKFEMYDIAKDLIKKYSKSQEKAIGVIFKEMEKSKLKIHPLVWVREINTLYYETACGSGTTAVGILESIKQQKDLELDVVQPSNSIITVNTIFKSNNVVDAYISGEICFDSICKTIVMDI